MFVNSKHGFFQTGREGRGTRQAAFSRLDAGETAHDHRMGKERSGAGDSTMTAKFPASKNVQ